jgi:predicted Zn-dependent protease
MAQTALANKRGYRSDLLSAASVAGTLRANANANASGDATFNSKATVAYAVSRDTQHMADQALRLWLVDHPADAYAWQVAAHVAQALGQPLRALRAQAESAAHTGQFEAAKDRFMAAQAMANRQAAVGNSDEQESAIVSTRLSQVANALRQQQLDDKP